MPKLLLLPGDGIGPEVTAEVRRVAERLDQRPDDRRAPVRRRQPRCERRAAHRRDPGDGQGVGRGADGRGRRRGRRSLGEASPRDLRPEAGLLALREGMERVRQPAARRSASAPLADASTPEARGGRGPRPDDRARADRRGLFRPAARDRDPARRPAARASTPRSTPPTRSSGWRASPSSWRAGGATRSPRRESPTSWRPALLWREVVTALHAREYPDVTLEHMLADNAAMQLVKNPRQFDVHRHRQPVRRHPFGRGGPAHRLARHAAVGGARASRASPASTSRSTARRPTSPARASPIRWRRSCRSRWRCAGRSAGPTSPTASTRAVKAALDGGARTPDIGGRLSHARDGRRRPRRPLAGWPPHRQPKALRASTLSTRRSGRRSARWRWPARSASGSTRCWCSGVFPVLLGALADEHRLSDAGHRPRRDGRGAGHGRRHRPGRRRSCRPSASRSIGVVGCAAAGGCSTPRPPRRPAGRSSAARGAAGAVEGVLLWITVAMIARTATPERWAGVFFTAQTVAQLAARRSRWRLWICRGSALPAASWPWRGLRVVGVGLAVIGPQLLAGPQSRRGDRRRAAVPRLGGADRHADLRGGRRGAVGGLPGAAGASRPASDAGVARTALWVSLAGQVVGGGAATALAGRVRWLPCLPGRHARSLIVVWWLFAPCAFPAGSSSPPTPSAASSACSWPRSWCR